MRHATEEGTPLLGPSRSESPVRPRRLFEERRGCCSSPLIICVGFSLGVWLSVRGQAPPVAGARASAVLEPVSRDTADARMRLSKHAVWHGQSGRLRALDLTVLTSFVFKDAEFVLAWFEDISRQQALQGFVVELVIGCFEEDAHAFMVQAVNRSRSLLGRLARVSVCLFADDPGIYGMWDMIIGREATAPVVTNWNVDDRKSPLRLGLGLGLGLGFGLGLGVGLGFRVRVWVRFRVRFRVKP